jgi:hypothetical protein
MMTDKLIDQFPLWMVMLLTLGLVLAASELGYWLGLRRVRSMAAESDGQVSALTAAHLGLLAFMMAFTFSVGAELAMKRKALIRQEANAIQVAYVRAALLNDPAAETIQQLLLEYTLMRADVFNFIQRDGMDAFLERVNDYHADLLQQIRAISQGADITELHALLVEAVNDVITLHNDRVVAGVRTRVPTIIWGSLYLLLLLSMLGMGYYNGMKERRSPVANTALAFSFTVVILLIADLDRPRDGLIKSDQFLMQDMGRRLQQLDWGESHERQNI